MAHGPRRDPPNLTGGGDRYEALLEVLEQQAAQKRADAELEARLRRRRKRESRVPRWLVAVLLVVAVWVWLFPPSFLRVEPPPRPPVAEEESSLRFAMYVQAQRIEAYRTERGRYPAALEEAGPPLAGMRYERLGPGLYQLTGETDRLVLTYRSDLPLSEFVGSGADALDESRIR